MNVKRLVIVLLALFCGSWKSFCQPFATINAGEAAQYRWHDAWSEVISKAIDAHGPILLDTGKLPMDQIDDLCPGFSKAPDKEKKAFWVLVIAAIAKYESNFNPDTRFQEPASLNYVYSEGLLQLSYGDETRYKNMPIDPAKKNILDPTVNLTSGVIILSRQIERGKKLFTDKHFYWSVLTRKQAEIKQFIRDHLPQLPFCAQE